MTDEPKRIHCPTPEELTALAEYWDGRENLFIELRRRGLPKAGSWTVHRWCRGKSKPRAERWPMLNKMIAEMHEAKAKEVADVE